METILNLIQFFSFKKFTKSLINPRQFLISEDTETNFLYHSFASLLLSLIFSSLIKLNTNFSDELNLIKILSTSLLIYLLALPLTLFSYLLRYFLGNKIEFAKQLYIVNNLISAFLTIAALIISIFLSTENYSIFLVFIYFCFLSLFIFLIHLAYSFSYNFRIFIVLLFSYITISCILLFLTNYQKREKDDFLTLVRELPIHKDIEETFLYHEEWNSASNLHDLIGKINKRLDWPEKETAKLKKKYIKIQKKENYEISRYIDERIEKINIDIRPLNPKSKIGKKLRGIQLEYASSLLKFKNNLIKSDSNTNYYSLIMEFYYSDYYLCKYNETIFHYMLDLYNFYAPFQEDTPFRDRKMHFFDDKEKKQFYMPMIIYYDKKFVFYQCNSFKRENLLQSPKF